MRELYIGGMAQGKLEYVCRTKRTVGVETAVVDCAEWVSERGIQNIQKGLTLKMAIDQETSIPVFYQFHLWVRNLVFSGENADQAFDHFLDQYPEWIIVSDEVGNGIVPLEKSEREYRECLGRILIRAAKQADRVERILCGLGQRIK